MPPLIVVNAVGLTPRLLAHAPRLSALAKSGWVRPMRDVLPSVTCSAQATMLTGLPVAGHGIVGNGWLYRDTMEVRFWQQSSRLMEGEPVYTTARKQATREGRAFRCAKLFWWFNQGADVDFSVTPKPYYGIDGSKIFGIAGTPDGLTAGLEREVGSFPFHTFWGPKAGLSCTQWIARCAAALQKRELPDLSLVYLPHLDYDPQRFGPSGCDMPALVKQLDDACEPILDAAKATGATVWVVSEYGHCDTDTVVEPNRVLRRKGLLSVRPGPLGETLDTFASRAFAVVEHQVAHVYVRNSADIAAVADLFRETAGVARVLAGEARGEAGLDHPRAGEIVLLSQPNAWFAYPFWLDDALAPDYARCVAIHHKPGYDPAELLIDPKIRFPVAKIVRKVLAKKLGFRMKMDVIPLDATLIRGSHGLIAADPLDGPILIASGEMPSEAVVPMTAVKGLMLRHLGLQG